MDVLIPNVQKKLGAHSAKRSITLFILRSFVEQLVTSIIPLPLAQVSSTGVMRIYIDNQLAISQPGHPPERKVRTKLYLGRSSNSQAGRAPDRCSGLPGRTR